MLATFSGTVGGQLTQVLLYIYLQNKYYIIPRNLKFPITILHPRLK
jgi:hypothetical protein